MLLSLVTFLPALGAVALLLLRGDDPAAQRNAKWIAFATTVITFIASLFILGRFDASNPDFQLMLLSHLSGTYDEFKAEVPAG